MGGHITQDSKLRRHGKEQLSAKSAMTAFQLMWGDQSLHTDILLEAEPWVSSLVPQVHTRKHTDTCICMKYVHVVDKVNIQMLFLIKVLCTLFSEVEFFTGLKPFRRPGCLASEATSICLCPYLGWEVWGYKRVKLCPNFHINSGL